MNRRDFLQLLAAAGVAGMAPAARASRAPRRPRRRIYDAPAFGNVSLLHITDSMRS